MSELVTNAVKFAPGPITLWLRPTVEGVHMVVSDTSTVLPFVRDGCRPGDGGLGWPMINALSNQVNVLTRADGKDVHVFMPW
ncbi:ATP-binding protein [Streptomyces sp. NPDC005279]|uniref:ATP-binding protein n=1 Tax=Streptomyces sp. NPDC005279 TaxID=3364712 RepID=UPI0036B7C709